MTETPNYQITGSGYFKNWIEKIILFIYILKLPNYLENLQLPKLPPIFDENSPFI